MKDRITYALLGVDQALLEKTLRESETAKAIRMSTTGDVWHSVKYSHITPFVTAALALSGQQGRARAQWWKNVLWAGAKYEEHVHTHAGQWSFVYHLTDGAPLYFGQKGEPARRVDAVPGQIMVFPSMLPHWTDAVIEGPRVSIAGNLYFQ